MTTCPRCTCDLRGDPTGCRTCGLSLLIHAGSLPAAAATQPVPLAAAPVPTVPDWPPPPPGWLKPVRGLGIALVAMLAVGAVVDLLAVFDDVDRRAVFSTLAEGGLVTDAEAQASDDRSAAVGIAQTACFVVTAVLSLVWLHRAHRNAHRLGNRLHHAPGWAIGAWFVPFLNLVRPVQIVRQTWQASDPALDQVPGPMRDPADWGARPGTALIPVWWGAWLLGTVASQVGGRLVLREDLAAAADGYSALMVADLASLAAGALFAVVVWQLSARQTRRLTTAQG